MTILYTEPLLNWGGEQNKVLAEIQIWQELGHKVILICDPRSQILAKANALKITTIEQLVSKKNFHRSVPALLRIIKEKNVNLVISNASSDSWMAAIAKIFAPKSVKFIRVRHNLYEIKGFLSKLQFRKMFDKVLFVSPAVRDYLKSIGVSDEKLFYSPVTIDIKAANSVKSTFRAEFEIPKDALVIGTFTSLYRKKGVYEFAAAAKKILATHKDAIIVFGGEINDSVKFEISAMFNENERVIFTGFRQDAINVIKGFDIYAFASHSEGLGIVLLEAMSSGVPAVVFNKAPMNELIRHEWGGGALRKIS